jgi:hypothetical protein
VNVVRVVVASLLLCGVGGCDPGSPADHDLQQPLALGACSELARVVYRWLGKPTACDAAANEPRELIALGEGYVLDWVPVEGQIRLWRVESGALPLGDRALIEGLTGAAWGHRLVALGGRRVLDNEALNAGWRLLGVSVNLDMWGNFLVNLINENAWSSPSWGREMLALDDDHLLEWWPGNGSYLVRRFDRAHETATATPFPVTSFAGEKKEFLLRGSRLVNLGGHRLLEWTPHSGDYRIWSYTFDASRQDIFDAAPVEQGRWAELSKDHEIMSIDADRILVWERTTGRVQLRQRPAALGDPLSGPLLSEATYPQLRSWDPEPPTTSRIERAVFVLQRGRSFDSYFGDYCLAPFGSGPTCTEGPPCCEAMPMAIRGAPICTKLDPTTDAHVPNTTEACMTAKINGGQMDGFADAPACGDPRDFACSGQGAAAGTIGRYHAFAAQGALADRFFQSTLAVFQPALAGADLNAIFLSKAGSGLSIGSEGGPHVTQLLAEARVRWAIYLDNPLDPAVTYSQPPPDYYDAHWTHLRWLEEIDRDIEREQLPAISIVIPRPPLSEQPGQGPAVAGIEHVGRLVEKLRSSPRYGPATLIVITHVTSGGFYDHVPPPRPPPITVDMDANGKPVPYGPRVPLLALGPFSRVNHVSHVPMELSSLTVFFEWNWLGGMVGQLGRRDGVVSNIGSLLDPAKTGAVVPE